MIKVQYISGYSAPMVICDICDRRIKEVKGGAAAFPGASSDGDVSDVMHVHKERCLDEAETRLRAKGMRSHWQELSHHLVYALANSNMDESNFGDFSEHAGHLGRIK